MNFNKILVGLQLFFMKFPFGNVVYIEEKKL
jgi:hypothetical protein